MRDLEKEARSLIAAERALADERWLHDPYARIITNAQKSRIATIDGGYHSLCPSLLQKQAGTFICQARNTAAAIAAAYLDQKRELEAARKALEAASSVCSEEGVREQLLCYNMGCDFLERLDDYDKARAQCPTES